MTTPSRMRAQILAALDRPERSDEPERHRDRPRQRQPERRRVAVGQQLDGDDAGGRREQRVLQRAEAEHAHAHLLVGEPRLLERVDVDREAAARDERTEAGGHRRDDAARPSSQSCSTRATSR